MFRFLELFQIRFFISSFDDFSYSDSRFAIWFFLHLFHGRSNTTTSSTFWMGVSQFAFGQIFVIIYAHNILWYLSRY